MMTLEISHPSFTGRETEAQKGGGEITWWDWQDQGRGLLNFRPVLFDTD